MCALLCALAAPAEAPAQPGPGGRGADDLDERVAEGLYQRGLELFTEGDYANAKRLFIESLERSPEGPRAKDALRMLRSSNERLGVDDLDAGRPRPGDPLDPYGDPAGPLEPYGDGGAAPLDPYPGAGGPGDAGPVDVDGAGAAQRILLFWGGAYGFATGLAIAGPQDDSGQIGGGPFLAGALAAGAGVGLSYLWFDRYPMSPGQASATASAGLWGAATFGLFGDVILFYARDRDEPGSDTNALYKFAAAGGLVGTGLGAFYAYRASPTEGDVALVNSLSLYGAGLGLLLGVTVDPPTTQAYSLQAGLGALAGLGVGVYLAGGTEVSRRRMLWIDAGAAAGAAAPWALLYPLVKSERAVGVVSSLTLVAGAVTAFLLTRDHDQAPEALAAAARPPPPPALLERWDDGRLRLGVPLLRPLEDPALAPPGRGRALGLDVFSGRF